MLVAVVGTVEVPNLLCFLWSMRREKLLNVRQELLGLGAVLAGVAVGSGLNWLGLLIVPRLT